MTLHPQGWLLKLFVPSCDLGCSDDIWTVSLLLLDSTAILLVFSFGIFSNIVLRQTAYKKTICFYFIYLWIELKPLRPNFSSWAIGQRYPKKNIQCFFCNVCWTTLFNVYLLFLLQYLGATDPNVFFLFFCHCASSTAYLICTSHFKDRSDLKKIWLLFQRGLLNT